MAKGFKDSSGKFRPTGRRGRAYRIQGGSSSTKGVRRRRGQDKMLPREQTSAGLLIMRPDEKPVPLKSPPPCPR